MSKVMEQKSSSSTKVVYLAWGVLTLFFFYQYIIRVLPGVMIEEIRHEFKLTADQFSTMGSWYLYAYSLLQIPLGIIVDKIGIKKTVLASILLCSGGALLMGTSEFFWLTKISRLMAGAGSACAFMCALKIVADNLPAGQRGLLLGGTLTAGTIGALIAGKPLVLTVDLIGWREVLLFTAALGLPIWLIAFFILPKKSSNPSAAPTKSLTDLLREIPGILKNRPVMLYALLAIGLYTPLSALADLWGTAFIKQKFNLPKADAANTTMMMYLGLALGSLTLPFIAEKKHMLNRLIQICGLALLSLFAFMLYGPLLPHWGLVLTMISLGFFCGAEMMCFTGALLYTNESNSGTTLGVVNTLNMLGGAILQSLIGTFLDFQWDGAFDPSGVRIYSTHEFVVALSILIAVISLCCLLSLCLKEPKNSHPHGQSH